jgi:hypothetical protein
MAAPSRRKSGARALLVGSLLSLSSGLAVPSVARAADNVTITPEARAHFGAGVNLLKDPDGARYEEAYREFKAAYASSPSYKILGNLGLCAMKLERDDEAIQAYEKYLAEAKDLSPSEIAQVKTDLATLKAGVAYLTVTSDPPGAKIIDVRLPVRGERITNIYGPITAATRLGVRQGSHQIAARLDGYPDVTWEIDAAAGDTTSHTFTFKKNEAPAPVVAQAPTAAPVEQATPKPVEQPKVASRPIPVGVYVGAAATGLLTAGAVVTGILALGKHSDFQTDNDGANPTQAQSDKNSGQTLNLVADLCIGGAVVGAAVTAVLFASRPTVMEDSNGSSGHVSWRVAPLVATTGGGLAVDGRF